MLRPRWAELTEVDAKRPMMCRGNPSPFQFVGQSPRNHERAVRWSMEPAHDRPDPICRNAGAKRDIVGESRVEAGGETLALLKAPAPRRPADRPFGGDMDRIGLHRIE